MKHLIHVVLTVILGCCLFMPAIHSFARASLSTKSGIPATVEATGDTLNLALTATPTTSFVSGWEKLGALNDGVSSTSSLTKPSAGAYGNWNGESAYGTYNWVQYEWSKANKLLSTEVYWWIDNTSTPAAGISKPTDAYVEYWNGASWVNFGSIGLELNKFNKLDLGGIMTSKIRLNMKSGAATGIIEWKVTGVQSGEVAPTVLVPYSRLNNGDTVQTNVIVAQTGDSVQFSLQPLEGGTFGWSGPNSLSRTTPSLTLRNLQPADAGTYTASYINEGGAFSSCYFHLTVRDSSLNQADAYIWPAYKPTLNYNFKNEFPALAQPTKDLNDCTVAGYIDSGWWTFRWGPKAKSIIDSASVMPLLKRMNEDFAYFRDTLGWPPDKRVKNGYRSAIYLFGSGLTTDTADSTELGGWQSATSFNGQSWPMVLLSYYPVYSFNPKCTYSDKTSQQGACVHEGIHAVLADLPGCKNSAWFQEGGNTWLQQEAAVRRTGDYSGMGFLNVGSFIAPFMPIECYSGWLQDGSFGGPSAEGVNMTNSNGAQVCTWRNLLGGVQYSNIFPVFLGLTLGEGSVAWIWRNCESRVLEGMADTLGEVQMRRLISEYRAKQAVLDMGKWTANMKSLLNSNMGVTIKAEWSPYYINCASWTASPYVKTTNDGKGLLTPEARTLPGWSGGNQIPLVVSGNEVTVNFQPIGRNMTCQLCYRTKDGKIVYSQLVNGGDCSLKLDLKPANSVVFAVIANTDYIYEGDTTRKTHYDYRVQLVKGVVGTAAINRKWYDWTQTIDPYYGMGLEESEKKVDMSVYPNPLDRTQALNINFSEPLAKPVRIDIRNLNGQLVYSDRVSGNASIQTGRLLSPGIYLLTAELPGIRQNRKLIVK